MAREFGLEKIKGPVTVGGNLYKGRAAAFFFENKVDVLVVCGTDEELAAVAEGMGATYDPSKTKDVLVGSAKDAR